MNTYNIYLAEAYLCLGKFDNALEAAQKINCDNSVNSCRLNLLSAVYIQSGQMEKAFEIINQSIEAQPAYGGWRYFIRALIYYEQGKKDLAAQDLATGDNYTWYGDGIYWYVKAKLAFDDGDKKNGLLYLQYAEMTLDVPLMPLRQEIARELKSLGTKPLSPTPQVPLATTPIP